MADNAKGEAESRPRLERIEDRAAFTEHTVDQMNAELIRALARLERLETRLVDLEQRLRSVEASSDNTAAGAEADGLQPPPHSASADERDAVSEMRWQADDSRDGTRLS